MVSHGNGHQYTWYDYLQSHLASYGYVVVSHQNNTVPRIQSCSLRMIPDLLTYPSPELSGLEA